jgi:phosphoglycerate dehydrogenase-like enzyme
MTLHVTVLDDYQGAARRFADWDRLGPDAAVTFRREHLNTDDELVAALAGTEVVVAMRERTPFTRARLERLPDLRLLVTTGMVNAAIDLAAAHDLGVEVRGTGSLPTPTAELTWGLIIGLLRHIPAEDHAVRTGGWQHTIGPDLAGHTLGVVGLGNLGERVARVGTAFGMRVIAWSQNLTAERAAEVGVELVGKEELFATSDVITVHLILSRRTRGLIGAAELGLMQPTSYLVNTSRGPLIDEAALVAALRDGRIAGAALDVYDTEPLPVDHPLRALSNTVLTPHLGYVTTGTYEVYFRDAVEDIVAWQRDEELRVLHPRG